MNKKHAIGFLVILLAAAGVFAYTRRSGTPAGNGGQAGTTTPTSTNGIYNSTSTSQGNALIWRPITISDIEKTKGSDGVYDLTKFNYPELITRGQQNNKKKYISNLGNFELSYSGVGYQTTDGSWSYPQVNNGIENAPDYLNFGGFHLESYITKDDSLYQLKLKQITDENSFNRNYRVRFSDFEAAASDNFTAIVASKNGIDFLANLSLFSDDYPSKVPSPKQKIEQLTEEGSYFFTVLNSIQFSK